MKRLLAFCGLFCALMVGFWVVSAADPTNFAGTWALDKAKSENMPRMWGEAEVTLVVTQNDKEITVETKVAGGGGGGGGRGMGGPQPPLTYKLDGSENKVDLGERGSVTTKAKWLGDGKILELNSVRKANFQGNEVTITTTDHLELADDGKTLKVHRKSENPRGTQESKLVFSKK